MEKFTEFHEGNNKISISDANYLVAAYGIGPSFKLINIPIERDITLDFKARLTSLRDTLIVDTMIYIVSVGDFTMNYTSLVNARKGAKKLEDEHIASLFGARA